MPGEIDAYRNGKPEAMPGKAIIVLEITNPGFQDFRSDASCMIRPQSLIGEKYVDCNPTLPRAPGSPPPPPLKQIPSGQPGAGQYLLPVENNSSSVEPDLINDIQTLPYAQRFRLILNELGAGLAGRGKDIEEVVMRANPVLREVDQLLGILNAQRDRLAQLASDSETILRPLSRERAHVAGFLANAGAAAQASSERGAALEASLQKFPRFLREFRLTMRSLRGILQRRHAGLHRPRQGGALADRGDQGADPVLRGLDRGAEEPRRHRGGRRSEACRSRSDRPQGVRTRASAASPPPPTSPSSSSTRRKPGAGTGWSN